MSLTLTIAPEIEAVIRKEAERQGTTPELLAEKTLLDRFATQELATPPLSQSAYEALLPFIGKFHSKQIVPAPLPEDTYERAFAEGMDEKYRQQGFEI